MNKYTQIESEMESESWLDIVDRLSPLPASGQSHPTSLHSSQLSLLPSPPTSFN